MDDSSVKKKQVLLLLMFLGGTILAFWGLYQGIIAFKIGGGVGFKIDGEKSDGTTAPHTGNVPSGTGGSDASGRQDAVVASWKQWIVDKIPDLPDIPYDMNDIKIASLKLV